MLQEQNMIVLRLCGILPLFFAIPSVLAVTPEQKQSVSNLLSKFIADRRAPGLQYVFIDKSGVLFQYQAGMADIRLKKPVEANTTFNAYSVTKTFTAAAVVKLALEGKIDLDQPITKYVKGLAMENAPTVRQTLQHTGGFPNPNPLPWIHRADRDKEFDEAAFIKSVLQQHTKLERKPGEKFAYSNVGYLVLGELVRQVSGKPYDEYVTSEIIKPLGLTDDQVLSFSIDHPERHARGYIRKWYWLNLVLGWFIDRDEFLGPAVNGWVPFNNLLVDGKAYGGMIGNASGFARYLQAMLNRKPPFTQQMLDTLWKIGATNAGEPTRTGLAWFHGTLNGDRYFMHSGGAAGYYCEVRIYPDIGRASVIMTNNTGISAQQYLDTIDPLLLPKRGDKTND